MAVLINGINYSWGNITVTLFGVPLVGILGIEYKRKQNKTNNYGRGNEPVSRGYGMREYEGNLEVYTDTLKAIIASAPNRDITQIPPFNIPVTFGGDGLDTTKDVLLSCEFLEDPLTAKSGDTKLTVVIPLVIGGIQR